MDHQPGDDILILTDNPTTLQECGIGLFLNTQVHTNRTAGFNLPTVSPCMSMSNILS